MTDLKKAKIIEQTIRNYYEQTHPDLDFNNNSCRKKEIVEMRHFIHFFIKEYTHLNLDRIKKFTKRKDHSSVIHSIKTLKDLCYTDRNVLNVKHHLEFTIKNKLQNSIYIAGTISKHIEENGLDFVKNKFQLVEDKLVKSNYLVVNPVKLFTAEETATFTQLQFMERCIAKLMTCNSIFMLADYKESYNACIELTIAKNLNLNIYYE